MRRWFLGALALLVCLSVTVKVFAFDPDSYNAKRGTRSVLGGGSAKMKAYQYTDRKTGAVTVAPALISSIRSSSGVWGSRITSNGTYSYRVQDGYGKQLTEGTLTRDAARGFGTFSRAVSSDGKFDYVRYRLTATGRAGLTDPAKQAETLSSINERISQYGYRADVVDRKGFNPRTRQPITYKTVKLTKIEVPQLQ